MSGLYKKVTMSVVSRGKIAFVAVLGAALIVVLASFGATRGVADRGVAVKRPDVAIVGPDAKGKPVVGDVSGTRPNILLIITDDQEKTSMRAMPHTLKLFKRQGVDFNHGYVTTPLCCPARATMYSGLYAHNHGILTNNPNSQYGSTYLWQNTFPAELQRTGYYTGQFGKYLNNWNKDEEGDAGFDVFKDDYNGTEHDRMERSTADILTARRGSRFVKDREQSDDQPWMMTLSMRSPHTPLVPEPRYQDARVPRFKPPISFNETDLSDKPKYLREKRYDKIAGLHNQALPEVPADPPLRRRRHRARSSGRSRRPARSATRSPSTSPTTASSSAPMASSARSSPTRRPRTSRCTCAGRPSSASRAGSIRAWSPTSTSHRPSTTSPASIPATRSTAGLSSTPPTTATTC